MQQPKISYQTYRMSKAIGIVINEFLERDNVGFSCKNNAEDITYPIHPAFQSPRH